MSTPFPVTMYSVRFGTDGDPLPVDRPWCRGRTIGCGMPHFNDPGVFLVCEDCIEPVDDAA